MTQCPDCEEAQALLLNALVTRTGPSFHFRCKLESPSTKELIIILEGFLDDLLKRCDFAKEINNNG